MSTNKDTGYIKTFRSLQSWQWYTTEGMLLVWTHLLLNARIEPGYSYGEFVDRGQLIIGRKKLSEKLNMSEQRVRTCLNRLKSTNEITMVATSKFTLITIIKWEKYQGDGKKSTKRLTKSLTNEQPTTNQQSTNNQPLNKNDKNDKNKDIKESLNNITKFNNGESFEKPTLSDITLFINSIKTDIPVDPVRFFNHYEAIGWLVGKNPMLDWKAMVRKWGTKEKTPRELAMAAAKLNSSRDEIECNFVKKETSDEEIKIDKEVETKLHDELVSKSKEKVFEIIESRECISFNEIHDLINADSSILVDVLKILMIERKVKKVYGKYVLVL